MKLESGSKDETWYYTLQNIAVAKMNHQLFNYLHKSNQVTESQLFSTLIYKIFMSHPQIKIDHSTESQSLTQAIISGDINAVSDLFSSKTANSQTPTFLIETDNSDNITRITTMSPLGLAMIYRRDDIVEALVADSNISNNYNSTDGGKNFCIAINQGYFDIALKIAKLGKMDFNAEPEEEIEEGFISVSPMDSALMYTRRLILEQRWSELSGSLEVLKILIDNNAEIRSFNTARDNVSDLFLRSKASENDCTAAGSLAELLRKNNGKNGIEIILAEEHPSTAASTESTKTKPLSVASNIRENR